MTAPRARRCIGIGAASAVADRARCLQEKAYAVNFMSCWNEQPRMALNAMRFARDAGVHSGGASSCYRHPPDEFNQLDRCGRSQCVDEARRTDRGAFSEDFRAKWMRDRLNVEPTLVIRERCDCGNEIINALDEDRPKSRAGAWRWYG